MSRGFLKFIAVYSAACACAFTLRAGEFELLDSLEKKGVITASEKSEIKKSSVGIVESTERSKRIRLLTFAHLRYQNISQDFGGFSDDRNFFAFRRIIPVLLADLTDNSRALVSLYMPSKTLLNTARYEVDLDTQYLDGTLWLGHEAVFFCMEEPMSGMKIMTPDRSIINMYFGGGDHGFNDGFVGKHSSVAAFSGYHTGAFWNGKLPNNKSVIYRLSVTNSKPEYITAPACNSVAVWASLGWDEVQDADNSLQTGVNAGYSSRVVSAVDGRSFPSRVGAYGDCWGINPYFLWKYKRFTLHTEFVATAMQYGKSESSDYALYTTNSRCAIPWGFYVLGAYKFDAGFIGDIEPVFRYLYLDTDGRGISENKVLYGANARSGLYSRVESFYGGFNWYVLGNSLKYAIGAEYADFNSAVAGGSFKRDRVLSVIAQVQVVF